VRTILAPAKINLVLEVGEKRADGYHELATVFQSIPIFDRIVVQLIPHATTDIDLTVHGARLPEGSGNLVWKAARLLADATGRQRAGISIRVEKNIPVAAGLGGGSSDAAATLQALAALWQVSDNQLLYRLAKELGSDVSFFLRGGSALGHGRGEILTPVKLPPMWLVLANPGVSCNTAAVYANYVAGPRRQLGHYCGELLAVANDGASAMAAKLHNDLASSALQLVPASRRLLEEMLQAGALGATVSGSGATVFGIAANASQAQIIAERIKATASWVWWGSSEHRSNGGGG
jgi:4-diphosphocytidyl-2-C-methyl-D-erythritol kinase